MIEHVSSTGPSDACRPSTVPSRLGDDTIATADRELNIVARLAQRNLRCQIALISLLDKNREWFQSHHGVGIDEAPQEQSFCAHVVQTDDALVIEDTLADARFATNPAVVEAPFVRFYAGVPVRTAIGDGSQPAPVGTLCVIDDQPRVFGADDLETLRDLARLVEICVKAQVTAKTAMALAEEHRLQVQRLDREQRQFRQAERMANIGSWRLVLGQPRPEWSAEVFAIHGLPIGDTPGLDAAWNFYPPHARAVLKAAFDHTIATARPFDVETDFITADGAAKRVRSMGEVEMAHGRAVAVIGVFQDITAQYRMEEALRQKASVDGLTQIANRTGCNEAIERRFAAARAGQESLALMLIDLDGFKAVNDRCGHHAGDEVLQAVGRVLRDPYLGRCFVGRLGGDEFVVAVSAPDDCLRLPALVRRLLLDLRRTVDGGGIAVAVSGTIGIAWLDTSTQSRFDLMRRADTALYKAKRECRGTAKIFGQPGLIRAEAAPRQRRVSTG